MALIKCPSCRTQISSVAKACPKCGYSKDERHEADPEEVKLFLKRKLRDRMYRLKMFSYVAMSIAMIGALPMLYDYIKGIEDSDPIVLKEHWGMYAVGAGFLFYVLIRSLMVYTRSDHKKHLAEAIKASKK